MYLPHIHAVHKISLGKTAVHNKERERDTCAECRCACAYRGTAGRRAFSRFIALRSGSGSRSRSAAAATAGDESNELRNTVDTQIEQNLPTDREERPTSQCRVSTANKRAAAAGVGYFNLTKKVNETPFYK